MVGFLDLSDAPYCSPCHEDRDEEVQMEADQAWSPALAAHVSSWRCPRCGHETMREETGEGVVVTTPDGERF